MMILADATLDLQSILFLVLGGLGLFLFGIKFMGEGLRLIAGDKIKVFIDKTTNSPLKGVFVGIIVTGLIQSSSGTTALSVGLVRAGLMTLPQAVGVIMGANIGTTVTAFLIGLKIKDYALPIMAVGAFLFMFAKKHKTLYLGQAILGFGALFYGMKLMGDGLKPISKLDWFTEFMVQLSHNPLLGVSVGLGLTVLVQSSSATIGILQQIYSEGVMTLRAALPILFGDNIGTTVTALLAALGGSAAARRASAFHIIFNLIGAVLFLILLNPYTGVVAYLADTFSLEPKMQIAVAHMVFNITVTIVIFPFAGKITELIKKFIKEDKSSGVEIDEELLNEGLIEQSPSLALEQAKIATSHMMQLAAQSLYSSYNYFKTRDPKYKEQSKETEDIIDALEIRIKKYLVRIASEHLNDEESTLQTNLLVELKDIERIGDHAINLNVFFDYIFSGGYEIETDSFDNIRLLFKMALHISNKTAEVIRTADKALAQEILDSENNIDALVNQITATYISSIKESKEVGVVTTLFGDIINNLEKVGDHCENIAQAILHIEKDYIEIDIEEIEALIQD